MQNNEYKERVQLLLRIVPIISKTDCLAIHGGTAINLFIQNLFRYSVDIDLTYIPIQPRDESLAAIKACLAEVKEKIKKAIPGIVVQDKPNKLICTYRGAFVKIEVNDVKRGIIGDMITMPLCEAAQELFGVFCEARLVPFSQIYGGKISAALDRQHPRDLFDIKYMFEYIKDFEDIRYGFMYCLLGCDRPILELLSPNLIDQREAMEKQFNGMTNIPFPYEEYENIRNRLVEYINSNLTEKDKRFLISFEAGEPDWDNSDYSAFKEYPSVKWKLLNIDKLKKSNLQKQEQGVEKLKEFFNRS
jgi:Domain of unknown function (DUF1814).